MPTLPFKLNQDRRHHIPKQKHQVTNWREYDASLRQRGSLTVWFSAEAIEGWRAAPRTTRGGQPWYSPLAIQTTLTLRAVFRLALRQTEGLIGVRGSAPDPAFTRPRSRRAGPLHPEPPSRDAGGAATGSGTAWRARPPAGGQHGVEALWRGRVAGREAWHQQASVLEEAAHRPGCRHRADRRGGADRQGCRRWRADWSLARPGRRPGRLVDRRRGV